MDNKIIYNIVICEDSDGSNHKYIFYAPTGMVKPHDYVFVRGCGMHAFLVQYIAEIKEGSSVEKVISEICKHDIKQIKGKYLSFNNESETLIAEHDKTYF